MAVKNLTQIFKKNIFPTHLIERVVNRNVTRVQGKRSEIQGLHGKTSSLSVKV